MQRLLIRAVVPAVQRSSRPLARQGAPALTSLRSFAADAVRYFFLSWQSKAASVIFLFCLRGAQFLAKDEATERILEVVKNFEKASLALRSSNASRARK